VVLQSARSVAVGVMLGIDPAQNDPLTPYLVNVKQSDLQAGNITLFSASSLPVSWASIAAIRSA
jgi:lipoprotein-releasing system permease protein